MCAIRRIEDVPIIALDGLKIDRAHEIARALAGLVYAFKIHDLYDERAIEVTDELTALSSDEPSAPVRIMLDYKLHDIPKTVGGRADKLRCSRASILTVHASGGRDMMRAARESAAKWGAEVYGITVLTSLTPNEVIDMCGRNPQDQAMFLAEWAAEAGVAGVVCSGEEVGKLKQMFPQLRFIVPGTRLPGASHGDQARVTTPLEALQKGATHLVWGREIVTAADPLAALEAHLDDIRPYFVEKETEAAQRGVL